MDLLECLCKLRKGGFNLKFELDKDKDKVEMTLLDYPLHSRNYNNVEEFLKYILEEIQNIVKVRLEETYKQFISHNVVIEFCECETDTEIFFECDYNTSHMDCFITSTPKELYDNIRKAQKTRFDSNFEDNFVFIDKCMYSCDVREIINSLDLFDNKVAITKNGKAFYKDTFSGNLFCCQLKDGKQIVQKQTGLKYEVKDSTVLLVQENKVEAVAPKYAFCRLNVNVTKKEIEQLLKEHNADRIFTHRRTMYWIDSVTNELIHVRVDLSKERHKIYDVIRKRDISFVLSSIDPKDSEALFTLTTSLTPNNVWSNKGQDIDYVINPSSVCEIPDGEYIDYITKKKFQIQDGKVVQEVKVVKEEKKKKYWLYIDSSSLENGIWPVLNSHINKGTVEPYIVCLKRGLKFHLNNNHVVSTNIESPFEFVDEFTGRKITL